MEAYQHILQTIEDKDQAAFIFSDSGDLKHSNSAAESMLEHLEPSEQKTIFGHLERQCKAYLILGEISEKSDLDLFLPNSLGEYISHNLSLLSMRYQDATVYIAILSDLPFSTGKGLRFSGEDISHYNPVDQAESSEEQHFLTETLPLLIGHAKANSQRLALFLLRVHDHQFAEFSSSQNLWQPPIHLTCEPFSKCLEGDVQVFQLKNTDFLLVREIKGEPPNLRQMLNSLVRTFLAPMSHEHTNCFIPCNIGAAEFPKDGMDSSSLLEAVNLALNAAENLGGNQNFVFRKSLKDRYDRRILVEQRLINAVENEAFELSFQPMVTLADKRHLGYEVNIHWNDSILGVVTPEEFMPIAEAGGLAMIISNWLLKRVFSILSKDAISDKNPGLIAIPVSAILFRTDYLPTTLDSLITAHNIEKESLVLELTEQLLQEDSETVLTLLTQIKDMGIKLSLKSFGAGSSPLKCIQQYPLDYLKIAPSCVRGIDQSIENSKLCTAITQIAHTFHVNVIAEGITTKAQYDFLTDLNCDCGQGDLFSDPILERDFPDHRKQPDSGIINGTSEKKRHKWWSF